MSGKQVTVAHADIPEVRIPSGRLGDVRVFAASARAEEPAGAAGEAAGAGLLT